MVRLGHQSCFAARYPPPESSDFDGMIKGALQIVQLAKVYEVVYAAGIDANKYIYIYISLSMCIQVVMVENIAACT